MPTSPRAGTPKTCKFSCGRPVHAKSLCKACYDRDLKARNPEYASRQLAQAAAHQASQAGKDYRRQRGPQAVTEAQAKHKRSRTIQRKYNISAAALELLSDRAGGRCEGCLQPARLDVDHDHTSGRVRGLLCRKCNMALGLLQDNPETFERLLAYLSAP